MGVAIAPPGHAAVLGAISVQGNDRIDDDTVRAYVPIRIGQNVGAADIDRTIDALFATGLFQDVSVSQSGRTLIVRVVENPVIGQISFEGNRRIDDDKLETIVRSKERAVFSRGVVQADVQRILDVYRSNGSFQASVEPQTINRGRNRVDLVFEVTEGQKTRVGRITFIGNSSFSDGRLRDVISTKETGILGFLRSTDSYDPDRLRRDQDQIRQFYFNRGFADFRILSANADFDRERNQFFITFTIDEGQRYEFGDVRVDTTLADLDPRELQRNVQSRPGRRYSAERIEKSLEELTLAANRQGYPFAQVVPTGERNFENNTIDVVYRVDQGVQAFIERIEIVGNNTTRDYVIRREFDIAEGDAYNRILLDRAERRLRGLGFFETVSITTRPGSAPDRVVVTVNVIERATGKVQFGVGYSTSDGVVGDVSISESNFLGRGQRVELGLGGGLDSQRVNFSFTEPYLFGRRVSGGFDIYANREDENNNQAYDSDEIGASLRSTLPLSESTSFQVFYNIFRRDVDVDDTECRNGNLSRAVCDAEGERLTSLVGGSLIYNTLDDRLNPRDGFYAILTTEVAGLGGDTAFVRQTAKARAYREILPMFGVVGLVAAEGGMMHALNDDLRVPDQFFVGTQTLRGFSSIGPRDRATADALGGRYYVAGTVEATFPIPFLPPEIGLTGAAFADAGSLWGADPDIIRRNGGSGTITGDDFALRASGGLGVSWRSPFGPIRADFALPLLEEDQDETQVFRLSGGTNF